MYLSLYHPKILPGSLSFHLRLEYHAVVHHRSVERLSKCRGPFLSYSLLVFLVFAICLSSLDILRYLPWRLTKFCVASKGYPSWMAFKWILGTHTMVLLSFCALQLVLILPQGVVMTIFNDDGNVLHQSLEIPSRESLDAQGEYEV